MDVPIPYTYLGRGQTAGLLLESMGMKSPGKRLLSQSRAGAHGFTLVEVVIVTALLSLLIVAGLGATTAMQVASKRLTEHTAARAIVQAKLQAIRAASYKPPNQPFTAGVVYLTNSASLCLDKAGQKFLVPGTVSAKIEPVASGHLVTVTGTFKAPDRTIRVQVDSVVNRFSGGRQ
jgi:prepilin-type N-terminal cleavage/methylation domain-containing protein